VGSTVVLVLACALSADLRVDASVGTQGTTRRTEPVGQPAVVETDVAFLPQLSLDARTGRLGIDAGYQPRLTLTDIGPHVQREVMHDARLTASLAPSSVWSLAATATGGIGRTDLITENLRPNLPAGSIPDTIATRQEIDVERAGLSLALRSAPSKRSGLDLDAGASVGGGANQASRSYLPFERTATAGAGYRYAVTPQDRIGLNLSGELSRFDQGAAVGPQSTAGFAVAVAGWRHQATPAVEVHGGAGAMWLYANQPGETGSAEPRSRFRPAGELGLDVQSLTKTTNGQAVARLWADIDRVTGEVTQQLQGSATLGWAIRPSLALSGRAGAALGWQTSGGQSRRGEVELRGNWAATRVIGTELGAYAAWQRAPSAPSFLETGAFVRLTLVMAPLTWRASE